MKKDCLNIGTIQAFLDGELTSDLLETAANHIALCDDCALQLAAAEEESALVFSALDQEFNTLVPTQRLWAKINDSIEKERKPFWQTVFAYFKNPTITAFASLLIVFGLFIGYSNLQNNSSSVAGVIATNSNTVATVSISTHESSNPIIDPVFPHVNVSEKNSQTKTSTNPQNRKNFQVVNANLTSNNQRSQGQNASKQPNVTPKLATVEYLPGEESYIKTIATLERNVNSVKDEVLTPSARFNYEQNLAVVNDAIIKMRAEVKKNPNNEAAKQVLMSSYQNKVDLLNSVAEKNQLMASMR